MLPGFYKPVFLIALTVIGILLLIHLWHRPRTIALKFSTLQFFGIQSVQKSQLRKFRRIVLLLTRILFISLIILLFAGIHFSDTTTSRLADSAASLFIWVDPSPSMEYSDGSLSIGQQAFNLVDSIASILPLSRMIFVYDHDIGAFKDYLHEEMVFKRYHGLPTLDQMIQHMTTNPHYDAHSVLLCISDFQTMTSDAIDSLRSRYAHPQKIICITKTPDSPWNFSLEDVIINKNGVLECIVRTEGQALSNGRIGVVTGKVRSAPVKVSVEKNGTVPFRIPIDSTEDGFYQVTLEADDPLPFDNSCVVKVKKTKNQDIVILGDSLDNFVIASALQVSGSQSWKNVILRTCTTISPDELRNASFIIVNSNGAACPVIERVFSLQDAEDKTVLYCMGTDEKTLDKILLGRLLPEVNYPELVTVEKGVFPVLPDIQSGIWSGFPVSHISQMTINRYRNPIVGSPLCLLNNGGVLFSLYDNEQGPRWIFSAIPLGVDSGNNAWETGAYVPILDRLMDIARKRSFSGGAVLAGFPVYNPLFRSRHDGFIYDQNEHVYPVADNPYIVFDKPGLYNVFVKGELKETIEVVTDTNESRMRYRVPGGIDQNGRSLEVFTQTEFFQLIRHGSSKSRYYILWIITILFIGVEIYLWGTRNDQYKDTKKNRSMQSEN